MGRWILFTDGASKFRGTSLGIILKSPQRDIIPQAVRCKFDVTNNEAEHEALIMGLQLSKDLKIKDLQVFFDSLLLTNHFNGSYVLKGEKLGIYLQILKNQPLNSKHLAKVKFPGKKMLRQTHCPTQDLPSRSHQKPRSL